MSSFAWDKASNKLTQETAIGPREALTYVLLGLLARSLHVPWDKASNKLIGYCYMPRKAPMSFASWPGASTTLGTRQVIN